MKIERKRGVLFAKGSLTASQVMELVSQTPKNSVFAPDLARMLGYSWAIGHPEDVDAYLKELRSEAGNPVKPDEVGSAESKLLPQAALEWLWKGRRGVSSNTLFACIFDFTDALSGLSDSHPLDPADFVRCCLMLEKTGTKHLLNKAAKLSPQWRVLVNNWDRIESAIRGEVPGWFEGNYAGSAKRGYDLMVSLLHGKTVET